MQEQLLIAVIAFTAGFIFGHFTKFELKTWVFSRGKNKNKN
jgi:hypothetical protein